MEFDKELRAQIVSPQVNVDRSVTFRLRAPNAKEVMIEGIAGQPSSSLVKQDNDVWEVTIGPLPAEIYSYVFRVDGTVVTDPANRNVKKWLSLASLVEVPGDPPRLHEQQTVPHGIVHHHLYRSKSTESDRAVCVYTPPGYTDRGEAYPLVLLLHGYGDDQTAWTEVGRAHYIADNLIAAGKIKPCVIAMPYGHPLPVQLRANFDDYASRNLQLMEQDVLQDLLPYLQSQYHLADDRHQRAIVGLSMGGGQSLTIGLQHLDQFSWVGGYSSAAPQRDLDKAFADLSESPTKAAEQTDLLWIGCGRDDFLLERNHQFINWLKEKQIEHVYRETDGGHDWIVWRKYLAEFLPQLFRTEGDETN